MTSGSSWPSNRPSSRRQPSRDHQEPEGPGRRTAITSRIADRDRGLRRRVSLLAVCSVGWRSVGWELAAVRVRLADVAKAAGVHPATVSRVLNRPADSRISQATVDRVLAAATDLKYSPNQAAQSLVLNRSNTLGVVIGDLTVPLFPPLLLGVDDVTAAAGLTALIVNTGNDRARETARIEAMRARQVDGLIVATATVGHRADEAYEQIAPTIYVVRAPETPAATSVLSDDAAGIHLLVRHLAELGHRRIAHVAGPLTISTAVSRYRAYREALFEAGLEFDPALVANLDSLRLEEATVKVESLLDAGTGLTAICAFNDLTALGAYRAIRRRGLSCPEDVSVVGFNDMTGVDLVDPPLTTVAVDHYAMGTQAAQLMLERLRDPESFAARTVRLPVALVERGSTRAPRA